MHFLRDCFGPIFATDSIEQARDRLSEAVAHLDGRLSKIATMLEDAEHDILAFYAIHPPLAQAALDQPAGALQPRGRPTHRRRRHLPDDRSLIRLAGMLCIEHNDECLVGRGYLSAETISLVLTDPEKSYMNEIKEKVAELQAA